MYVKQQTIYARAVSGWFATWRWAMVWATQLVFYGLPWLQWNDRQAVLFDLAARRFYIFGLVLYPQDFIYLTALLIISAYALFLFTAVAGRLWCGFTCPQTVYTEIFMWVERQIEGDRIARMKRDAGPWNLDRSWRAAAKQAVWIAIALWTGFTFVGYFTPIQTLAQLVSQLALRALGKLLGDVLRLGHLRQRRLPARAGVQVHVPLCALPERDVRQRHADRRLRPRARRAARLALAQGRPQGHRQGRLHRLRPVRAGLPDRHRHPQGPAVRMHRLHRLHRRVRRRDGQDGLPARADPLRHAKRHGAAPHARTAGQAHLPSARARLHDDPDAAGGRTGHQHRLAQPLPRRRGA